VGSAHRPVRNRRVVLLSIVNIFGIKPGHDQNFHGCEGVGVAGLVLLGLFVGRNPQALARELHGHFWQNADWLLHAGKWDGRSTLLVGTLTILAVAQVVPVLRRCLDNVTFTLERSRIPARNLPLSLAMETGVVILLYILCNVIYLNVLPLDGSPAARPFWNRLSSTPPTKNGSGLRS